MRFCISDFPGRVPCLEKDKELQNHSHEREEMRANLEKMMEKHKRQMAEMEKLKKERMHTQQEIESNKSEIRELKGQIGEYEKERCCKHVWRKALVDVLSLDGR